mmetsp:Transcript_37709/g.82842  ORF Transcript_37709/g.82842 Transcript_37709/m.82842 type:complete len:488 (-) Transcript_37709:355-1818(-)
MRLRCQRLLTHLCAAALFAGIECNFIEDLSPVVEEASAAKCQSLLQSKLGLHKALLTDDTQPHSGESKAEVPCSSARGQSSRPPLREDSAEAPEAPHGGASQTASAAKLASEATESQQNDSVVVVEAEAETPAEESVASATARGLATWWGSSSPQLLANFTANVTALKVARHVGRHSMLMLHDLRKNAKWSPMLLFVVSLMFVGLLLCWWLEADRDSDHLTTKSRSRELDKSAASPMVISGLVPAGPPPRADLGVVSPVRNSPPSTEGLRSAGHSIVPGSPLISPGLTGSTPMQPAPMFSSPLLCPDLLVPQGTECLVWLPLPVTKTRGSFTIDNVHEEPVLNVEFSLRATLESDQALCLTLSRTSGSGDIAYLSEGSRSPSGPVVSLKMYHHSNSLFATLSEKGEGHTGFTLSTLGGHSMHLYGHAGYTNVTDETDDLIAVIEGEPRAFPTRRRCAISSNVDTSIVLLAILGIDWLRYETEVVNQI